VDGAGEWGGPYAVVLPAGDPADLVPVREGGRAGRMRAASW
jgi:hypothetical protein